MSKNLRTPIIRPRTQGGTFYTFGSAMEDIGMNINEGRNKVEMSHYILLNLPDFDQSNDASVDNIHTGGVMTYANDDTTNRGDMMFAEGFQDYVLNMETVVRNQDSYNFASPKTISERVFWKWLFKNRGSGYFTEDASHGCFYENQDKSIAKAFGTISAGSQRTDDNGVYNETFVQIPSSYGQMRVYFRPVYDENYTFGSYTGTTQNAIEGFGDGNGVEDLTTVRFTLSSNLVFPDVETALTTDSSVIFSVTQINTGSKYVYAKTSMDTTAVQNTGTVTWKDTDETIHTISYTAYAETGKYTVAKTTEISTVPIADSSSDGYYTYDVDNSGKFVTDSMEAVLDIESLRKIYEQTSLTYDDIGMGKVKDGSIYTDFSFNAILVYYSIYNSDKSRKLATNAYGLYILDNAVASSFEGAFFFPSLNKAQATTLKQGSSYSFRINIKPTTAYSGDISVNDNSTAAFAMSEDFTEVIRNLSSAVTTLRNNTKLLYNIKKDNDGIKDMVSKTMERIDGIQSDIDGIVNGNFPYTADGLYRKNPSLNIAGTISPAMAKAIIDAMTIKYTESGGMAVTINTSGMSGDTLIVANNLMKTMNTDTYYDMISLLLLVIARTKTPLSTEKMDENVVISLSKL